MSAQQFEPIAPRPSPVQQSGPVAWARRNLFADWRSTTTTVFIALLLVWALPGLWRWMIAGAVFQADANACQAARGVGACWGVIAEKYRIILFGRYPFDEQWRPLVATLLVIGGLVISCMRAFWKRWLVLVWAAILALFFLLMGGGWFGLSSVRTELWGGFPLTIMLAVISLFLAFPLAVVVALGRRAKLPAIRTISVLYVELVRGVPLISVLFMASFMFPLFVPQGVTVDVLVRVIAGLTLFIAAYMAETVRGGLQAVPKGQFEAADSLGLGYWQTQRLIVLPQALSMVVPSIMNTFISLFKDTSLVTIVSLYELTGALALALNSDVQWRPFKLEAYFFITLIYFTGCFAMSRYSLWVEKQLAASKAR
ncbi:MAG: amino acid ABC transporter permease [Hydrogenophaga sp.]|nr:amino acid ABC transporter permease [Hydrogenophaga sp.]